MRPVCRSAGLLLVALAPVGCAKLFPNPTDPGNQPESTPPPVAGQQREGNLAVPADGGPWPWRLAPAVETTQPRPVEFSTGNGEVTSFAARPTANRAAVTIVTGGRRNKSDPATTRVLWCDTAAGAVLAEWDVPGGWRVWDVSPDGREILAGKAGASETRNDTLAVWAPRAGKPPRKEWTPHDTPNRPAGMARIYADDVAWAAWVGPGRIVSMSRGGEVRVFDADTAASVGAIDGFAGGRPAVTPDGTMVVVPVQHGVLLLDPATPAVVGTRRIEFLRKPPAVAASPNGSALAVAGHDRASVLDLTDGSAREVVCNRPMLHDKDDVIEWAGNRHLFTGRHLFDLGCPTPAWAYEGAVRVRGYGRRTWAVVTSGTGRAALRAFTLPHQQALATATSELGKPGQFHLKQGDGVRVDVSALPADKQAAAATGLEARLREAGYQPDPNAAVVLRASEAAQGKPATVKYQNHPEITYTLRDAELRLVRGTKVLWHQEKALHAPFSILYHGSVTPEEHVRNNYGHPDHTLFTNATIPPVFPGPNPPRAPLGVSDLTLNGVRDR